MGELIHWVHVVVIMCLSEHNDSDIAARFADVAKKQSHWTDWDEHYFGNKFEIALARKLKVVEEWGIHKLAMPFSPYDIELANGAKIDAKLIPSNGRLIVNNTEPGVTYVAGTQARDGYLLVGWNVWNDELVTVQTMNGVKWVFKQMREIDSLADHFRNGGK
jgi:hypothetical protein